MLEGALTFLVILTSLRIHLGKWYNTGCSQSTENKPTVNSLYLYFLFAILPNIVKL